MSTPPQATLPTVIQQWNSLLDGASLNRFREHRTENPNIFIPPESILTNNPWGDTMEAKPPNTFRLYSQNANGIQLDAQGGKLESLCHTIQEVQADITAIQEHNLDTNQYYVNKLCRDTINRTLTHSKFNTASSPIQTTTAYKPGGTLLISQGDIIGRYLDSGQDELGRWSYQGYIGRNNRLVTVISAYQVCAKSTSHRGRYTAAAQQESILRTKNKPYPHQPRKHFRQDLSKFLTARIKAKHQILLLGDFNEAIGEDSSGMSKICTTHNLVDIMFHRHGNTDLSTYSRGKKRLDYILGSQEILTSVQKCGYEPFCHRLFSDHRAFFVDFDMFQLFGSAAPNIASRNRRDIQAKSPKQVTVYIEELYRLLENRNCFERSSKLHQSTRQRRQLAETLDRDLTKFALKAAKTCKQHRTPAWSVKLAKARNKVGILKRALFIRRTRRDATNQIILLQQQRGADFLIPDTIKECNQMLRKAQAEIKAIIQHSAEIRQQEQRDKITQFELRGDDDPKRQKQILKKIQAAEAIKKMFKKIKYQRNAQSQPAISRIEIPKDPTVTPKQCKEWKTIDAPEEILQKLLERNQEHFGQAEGPFLQPPLSQQIDFTASTVTTELILEGEYSNPDLDEITQLLLKHCARHDFPPEETISVPITDSAFVSKIKTWNEGTSTSPSGLHLGHYHALIARHSLSGTDSTESSELDRKQAAIRELRLTLINYGLKWGYSYDRWKTIVDVMIFKDPGNCKIHRLRIIHLYEADYNLILGIKWRAMMHLCEDFHLLNPGQYGGRAARDAKNPVFIEEMQNEISRASRKSLAKLDNDATSCYDRILPSLASIVSRQHGIPKNVAFVMARTLEEARYKLKTILGVSEEYYKHSTLFPIYGTGQGSGNSPAIWCIISSVLFTCHETKAHGATFETPDRSLSITLYMIGFVDDSTGQTNDFSSNKQPNPTHLLKMLQHDAQLWNDLLYTSGGALELPKCSYHYHHWIFTPEGAPVLKPGQVGADLVLKSGDRTQSVTVPSLSAHTAHKTLGHYPSPAGNQTRQYQVLKTKSDAAGVFIQTSSLDRREAWTFYFSIYLTSIGYPLSNCFFSKTKLSQLQSRAMRSIFAKCGFNRNTKQAILYGPTSLGGANFRHLYTEQGTEQILNFLKMWRSNEQSSSLLRIAVAWHQLSLGTGTSFLFDVTTPLPHIESKWLDSLRTYLGVINGHLELDNDYVTPLQRQGDFFLMDKVIESDRFTPLQIKRINYCRLYLQVLTISDITHANGTTIDPSIKNGTPSARSATTNIHHVHQDRPSIRSWRLWKSTYSLWCSPTGKLHQPLGRWNLPPSQLRRTWHAYYDPHSLSIYVRTSNNFQPFGLHNMTTTHYTSNSPPTLLPPPRSVPVSIYAIQGRWSMDQFPATLPVPPCGPTPGSFEAYLDDLELWESSLLNNIEYFVDPLTLATTLSTAIFSAASDGSVLYDKAGAFGWIIGTEQRLRLVKCSGPAFGSKITSYRAEGYGMLSILRFILRLFQYFSINFAPLRNTIACDNQSLVDNAKYLLNPSANDDDPTYLRDQETALGKLSTPNTTLISDWDVLYEIYHTLQSLAALHFVPYFQWVKGHQDRDDPYHTLPYLAQLNCDADKAAGEFQRHHSAPRPIVPRLPHNTAQLFLSQATITFRYKSFIRYAECGPPLLSYLQHENYWSDETIDKIHWDAHRISVNRHHHQRVFIIKLVHDVLPTNSLISKWTPTTKPSCHICDCPLETRDHIIQCRHVSRQKWRDQLLISLRSTCSDLRTCPVLTDILHDGVDSWINGTGNITPNRYPPNFHQLVLDQTSIGWRQLFNGRFSQEWARLQELYLHTTGNSTKQRTGTFWISSITSLLWNRFDTVWKTRNGEIHGIDKSTIAQAQRATVISQIETIYQHRNAMLHKDQDILYPTLQEHTNQSTHRLQNWYRTHLPAIKHSIRESTKRALSNVKSLRHYFSPPT